MCNWWIAGAVLLFIVVIIFLAVLSYYLPQQECKPRQRKQWDPMYVKLAFITLWLIITGVFVGIMCGRLGSCSLSFLFWIILLFTILAV